jgi:poly-gamma-glutamate capsule biosynthesis protein CapA/YwtB (metallophosphatase superfamily)
VPGDVVTLFLSGDVMLGRGIDQILAHPGDPRLREPSIEDARGYVALAERINGPISRPVDGSWPWGDALPVLDGAAPDVRVINLETAVTTSDDVASGKAVHYRMSPDNLACLLVADPDVCVLANNHVLDFGVRGLEETLDVLSSAGLRTAGAGRDAAQARRPVTIPVAGGGRVLVSAWGMASSGIPERWDAARGRPGVAFLPEPSGAAVRSVVDHLAAYRRSDDIVVVSIHWGSNWGYEIPRRQVRFAHALIDEGVDVVHGHSSHHPRPIEVYRDRLILYGCGDLINDYEGITGHEGYRTDLRLLHLVSLVRSTGELVALRMIPMRARQLRLRHASGTDLDWLGARLDRVSRPFGVRIDHERDGALTVRHRPLRSPAGDRPERPPPRP